MQIYFTKNNQAIKTLDLPKFHQEMIQTASKQVSKQVCLKISAKYPKEGNNFSSPLVKGEL